MVWPLRLVTVGAFLELGQLEREVAAALALARVRHPSLGDSRGSCGSFRIRHRRLRGADVVVVSGPVAGSGRAALERGADG